MSRLHATLLLIMCGSLSIQAMDLPRPPAERANPNPDAFAYLIEAAEQEMDADGESASSSSSISEEDKRTEEQRAQTDVNFALIVACRRGDSTAVQRALTRGAHPNAQGLDGVPALFIAARYYHGQRRSAMLNRLLSDGRINPNPSINGRSLRDEMSQAQRSRAVDQIDRARARRNNGDSTEIENADVRGLPAIPSRLTDDHVMYDVVQVPAAAAVNYDSVRSQDLPVTQEALLAAAEEVQRASEEESASESEISSFDDGIVPTNPSGRLMVAWRAADRYGILDALRAGAISKIPEEEAAAAENDVDYRLIIACRKGHQAQVHEALRAGVDPNALSHDGFPAIVIVAFHTNSQIRTRMIGHLFNAPIIDPNPIIGGRTLMFIMNLLERCRAGEDIMRGLLRYNKFIPTQHS